MDDVISVGRGRVYFSGECRSVPNATSVKSSLSNARASSLTSVR